MPYRDKAQKVEALKKWREKRREVPIEVPVKNDPVLGEVLKSQDEVPPEKVKSLEVLVETPKVPEKLRVRAETDPQWKKIEEYISRPTPKGQMPNLERLQRIAGSLGKLSGHVFFGLGPTSGLTAEEIGKTLGVKGPLHDKG